jgi:hypothetical protein
MSLRFDDNEKIKEAKRDTFLSHLLRLGTEEDNHDAAVILKKAGLSGYLDNYEPSLQPFSFNGHWKNENTRYQPEMVFDDIYNQIGGDRAHQYTFLKAVVEQITNLNKHDYSEERFNRYLALLGYEIISSNDPKQMDTPFKQLEYRSLLINPIIRVLNYWLIMPRGAAWHSTMRQYQLFEMAIMGAVLPIAESFSKPSSLE